MNVVRDNALNLIKREGSYSELIEFMKGFQGKSNSGLAWLGGSTPEELAGIMADGEPELALKAESMFQDVLDAVMPDTDEGFEIQRCGSPVGAFPNVGAFVVGRPDSMFGAEPQEQLGPVRLFVDLLCQAQLDREDMLRRGVAISALAYALQTVRPVELYVVTLSSCYGSAEISTCARLGVSPFDLTTVATAVSHVGIGRYLLQDQESCRIYGSFTKLKPKQVFGLQDGDVYFPPLRQYEADAWREDPIGALREQCADQLDCLKACAERGAGAQ